MAENLIWKQGSWWARKFADGKARERKLKTDNKAIARKRRDAWLSELEATNWGEKPRRTFEETAERFAREHFPHLKPGAAKRYDTSLIHLLDHFFGRKLDTLSSADFLAFENERKKTVADATIIRDLACLSSVFSCAEEWEWIDTNPVKPFLRGRKRKKALIESEPRTRYLSHDEERALLAAATDRLRPLIIFAIQSGLRRAEQFGLCGGHISLPRSEITVPAALAKSRKSRTLPLLAPARAALSPLTDRHVFTTQHGNGYSPKSQWVWESLQKAAKRAEIEDLTWHDLRRTCGCRLLQDYNLTMHEVSKWLGHSSVRVTEQRYAFMADDQLHRAVARTGPTTLKVVK